MQTVAVLKRAQTWPERDGQPERDVLHLVLAEGPATGQDLTVSAAPEAFTLAGLLEPLTPVRVKLEIEATLYRGSSARLIAVDLIQLDASYGPEDLEDDLPDEDDRPLSDQTRGLVRSILDLRRER